MIRFHEMPFGARALPGGVRFRLWAPGCAQVRLALEPPPGGRSARVLAMEALRGGWHEALVREASVGTRYRFVVDGNLVVPDPASRCNPDDVHGPSLVTDPFAYRWRHRGWRGRPWHEAVVYELHVGTFTPQGTFAAAAEKLPDLAALGITAIELMPVADFPGARGWGYDGVLPFAPDASYGMPDDLKALVDTAHGLGLMVLLDVVYNHFGPEGNYLHAYAKTFFDEARQTPWGAAIDYRRREVRDFVVHNALYWVEEFAFDGLRLDAVHAIHDDSAEHLVAEIGRALRAGPGRERHVHLVLENDANLARFLERDATAQWNDDLHHAAHVLLTGETDGYYGDYAGAPLAMLGRALAEGYVYQGEPSALRQGEPRGEPSGHLPPTAFVSFLQNHDQVGNRAFGDRLHTLVHGVDGLRALQAALLLSPHVPLLFMGEEWAASTPFLYFCDFGPELAAAVSHGRREEFGRFAAFRDPAARAQIPDPNDPSTFAACVLRWDERDAPAHRAQFEWIAMLLRLRRERLVPLLDAAGLQGGHAEVHDDRLQVVWTLRDGLIWQLRLNLGRTPVRAQANGDTVFAHRWDGATLDPGGVLVGVEAPGGG